MIVFASMTVRAYWNIESLLKFDRQRCQNLKFTFVPKIAGIVLARYRESWRLTLSPSVEGVMKTQQSYEALLPINGHGMINDDIKVLPIFDVN